MVIQADNGAIISKNRMTVAQAMNSAEYCEVLFESLRA
jgi:hypothetical protein